ncbi:MAG TPA: alanine racemase [Terriglobia bacterium]|nr:alanine racemase [Terriglobia bacterium]
MKTHELDTPALLVDLNNMESNLARMASFLRQTPAKLRPHFKNHRIVSLAKRQLEAGAIGMTCARLSQAEVLIQNGIRSVLIANEIVGEAPIKRFLELSQQADLIAPVDNEAVVADMARLARDKKTQASVLVDLDVGLKRCGVPTMEAALRLARVVTEKGLRLRGVMAYEGHLQPIVPGPEKERAVRSAMQFLTDAKNLMQREGLPAEIASCGGTGTYSFMAPFPGVTEIQAGSYLLMDTWYKDFAPEFKLTLSLLVTVISKTPGQRIVVDAGVKALSGERGLPSVKEVSGLRLKALHAEHGVIEIMDSAVPVEVGDKIELWVHYHDGTINLHKRAYGIRSGQVEEAFTIEG